MTAADDNLEPTEATPLLVSNGSKNPADEVDNVRENGSSSAVSESAGGKADEETGEVEETDNPLLEGNAEVLARLPWLLPPLAIGVLLVAADQTVSVTTYGRIGTDLDALNNTSWIATAYFLTITSFQPLYGRLSDIFGRKAALLFAYTVFGTGCLFCGLARNLQELIAARAFAGIGGGGMTTVVSILLSDIVPLRERGTWQGYLNIIFTIGSSSGAALGGVIADSVGWRWVFLGQTPLCLVAFTAVYFCLDLPRTEESHWREKIGRVDFLGSVSLVVGIFALLVGLDHGSNVAWSDTLTIICCSITLPLFAIFIFIEMKVATYPLTPGHIIFDRSLIASYLCNFFVCLSFLACLFYIPLYLQVVEGMSASAAGVRFIPITIVGTVGSLFGGVVMQKTGKYYWLTVISFILQIFSILGILVCSALGTNYWGLLICLIVTSFGAGLAITATLINVIANSDPADQAVATASTYLFRSLGSICGVSFAGAVIQQTLRVELRKSLDSDPEADKITEHVRQSLDYIKELDPHTRELVRICYRHAETAGFAFALCTAFGGVIASWYIREKRLSK